MANEVETSTRLRVLREDEREQVRKVLERRGFEHRAPIGDWVLQDDYQWWVWDGVHDVIRMVVKPPAYLENIGPLRLPRDL